MACSTTSPTASTSPRSLAEGARRAPRPATIASAIAFCALAAYGALTWDAFLTNFQVRWMCDEDVGYAPLQRTGVSALAIPGELVQRDARVLATYEASYPTVVVESGEPRPGSPDYALTERWPKVVRRYWGYAVVLTELSVVDRRDRNRVLGTSTVYRRVGRPGDGWAAVRAPLVPRAEQCTASDRVDFVRRVLRPPD